MWRCDMKKVLITGSSGFVGRNIFPYLAQKYNVFALSRTDIDLMNQKEVERYLSNNEFDCVIHLANPSPGRYSMERQSEIVGDSMRLFLNFFSCRHLFGKMIYTGSGAEYNKLYDISCVKEEKCLDSIPYDGYGLAKYMMNQMALGSRNVYNLRVFGCYGPTDHESKFITHCIRSNFLNLPITIRKDCYFDYLHVNDLAQIITWAVETDMKYHDYNACSGKKILLSEIAQVVNQIMGVNREINVIDKDGLENEYTGDNSRLIEESHICFRFPIEKGIKDLIEYEKEIWIAACLCSTLRIHLSFSGTGGNLLRCPGWFSVHGNRAGSGSHGCLRLSASAGRFAYPDVTLYHHMLGGRSLRR